MRLNREVYVYMKIIKKELACCLLESPLIWDQRGWFHIPFCAGDLQTLGLNFGDVCQLNHSFTEHMGIVRGPNYQKKPFQQAKIVRCTKGAVYSVGIDIDRNSITYGQWCGFVLSEKNKHLMYVPDSYAHGFITLEENTELEYFTDNLYSGEHAASFAWNDPEVAIDWTCGGQIEVNTAIMSEKNRHAPMLDEVE